MKTRYSIRKIEEWWTVARVWPYGKYLLCRASTWEAARNWLCNWTEKA